MAAEYHISSLFLQYLELLYFPCLTTLTLLALLSSEFLPAAATWFFNTSSCLPRGGLSLTQAVISNTMPVTSFQQ